MHARLVAAIAHRMLVARVERPRLPGAHVQPPAADDELDLGMGDDGDVKPQPPEWKVPRHVAVGMKGGPGADGIKHQLVDRALEEIADLEHLRNSRMWSVCLPTGSMK